MKEHDRLRMTHHTHISMEFEGAANRIVYESNLENIVSISDSLHLEELTTKKRHHVLDLT